MEMFQRQHGLDAKPKLERKPSFPKELLHGQGRKEDGVFIDPAAEAAIILPQASVASAQIVLEAQAAFLAMESRRAQERSGARQYFSSLYEYVLSWLSQVKRKFSKNARVRARMTKQGERTLEQLRYLSLLCDATECRSHEEYLSAESAFGEAYFEIKKLSEELERMSKQEEDHHVKRYERHMASLIRASD